MARNTFDVVVIGAGAAGFAAAASLKAHGKSVVLLTKAATGPGGCLALASGSWDLGPLPMKPYSDTLSLEEACGWGPFRRAVTSVAVEGIAAPTPESWSAHLNWLAGLLSPSFSLNVRTDRAWVLPCASGTWKRTFAAEALHARADLSTLGSKAAVVGSRRWRFPSESLAARWKQSSGHSADLPVLDVELKGADWPLTQLAVRLVRDGRVRELFRDALKAALKGKDFDTLVFPPIFLDADVADRLGNEIGVKVAECLGGVDPASGLRISTAVEAAASRLGIPLVAAPTLVAERGRGGVSTVRIGKDGTQEFRASAFVLATGKCLGGGLRVGWDELRETVLDLPLFVPEEPTRRRRRNDLCWDRPDGNPIATLGVRTDGKFRPVDETGLPLYGNLRACGSLLSGADFPAWNLGLGYHSWLGAECAKTV